MQVSMRIAAAEVEALRVFVDALREFLGLDPLTDVYARPRPA